MDMKNEIKEYWSKEKIFDRIELVYLIGALLGTLFSSLVFANYFKSIIPIAYLISFSIVLYFYILIKLLFKSKHKK